MDKAQARFILQSFRPDGADVDDHDFAEALALAIEDRELGEWLAHQRAFDAAFANALSSIELPDSLRQNILGCLAAERGDFPQAADERDAAMIGAFASIQVPKDLRNRVLTAMERSGTSPQPVQVRTFWRKLAVPLAAAAGVTLAFLVTSNADKPAIVKSQAVHVDLVQAGFIRTFESPLFSLDETWEDPNELADYLKSRKLPCPGCLPPGLVGVKSIGCRELVVDGKKGFMVCFDEQEAGSVHLLIFRREDVSGSLPEREHPSFAQKGNWVSARWEDDRHVFLLVGTTELRKLAALF
jgi:hypothetical protein